MSTRESRRLRLIGALVVLTIVALVVGVVGGYAKTFTPTVAVTVRSDRSGLLMDPGAAVAMRGVTVGEVRAVHPDTDGEHAVLDVALDPEQVSHIPANVLAEIDVPTLLGPKYIDLHPPAQPSRARISEGTQILTTSVSTEVNSVLWNLNTLLTSIDVAKLNSALGALSTALHGRGDQIGRLALALNSYLRELNPSVPVLGHDLALGAGVLNTYADVSPGLVRALDNLAVTSDTLTDEKTVIPPLLAMTIQVSSRGRALLDRNGEELRTSLRTLRPTTGLLARYSPMFPCLFASSNQLRADLENVMGGQYPGLHAFTSLLPAQQGYQYPRDLPKVGATTGPSCFGGPLRPADAPFPHVQFDDGWKGFVPSDQVRLVPGSPLPDPLPRPLPRGVDLPSRGPR
jgi:phospholipid/cholesterol/gamma-HCH transport system substrate-binding protein